MPFQALSYPGESDLYLDPKYYLELSEAWNGAGSAPMGLTGIDDDVYAAATLRNRGLGAAFLAQDTNGAQLMSIDDIGTALTNLFGSGTADIAGDTALGALLDVIGATTLNDTLHGVGAVTFDDIMAVAGAGTFGATVDVTGDGTFAANVDIAGDLTVGGDFLLEGLAIFEGDTEFQALVEFMDVATFGAGIVISAGNLAFTTTGQRITGNLSAGTHADRLMIQNSVSGGNSVLGILPNGAGTVAAINAYGSSNPAASAIGQLAVNAGTDVRITSAHAGASFLPLTFWTGGAEQMSIAANGDIKIGSSTTLKIGFFGDEGAAQATGGSATAGATYTSDEQDMLQILWDMARSYGLIS